ncbi:MAG: RNA polymerase factor sigma-54 [Gammaproteobacteria bacterium]
MNMKQSLHINLGQQLTLTPQLQQAIRLLQLSTVELAQEIQQVLDSNPLLELKENSDEATSATNTSNTLDIERNHLTAWEDQQQGYSAARNSNSHYSTEDFNLDNTLKDYESLKDHLLWQMRLSHFSPSDELIALAIIDAIDENGFLQLSLEDIHQGLVDSTIELDEVESVLKRIQLFDPVGVGARSIQECLLIQLKQLPSDTPWRHQAMQLIAEHFALLGTRNYRQLQQDCKLNANDLKAIIECIKQLNPRPAAQIATPDTQYVVPDVLVYKHNGRWQVELNNDISANIHINNQYASMIKRANSSSDNQFLRDHLQEARWFLKSLQSRNETLLKVARCIVDYQRDFFEYGEEAMKPLVLHDVARAIDMHESTISRVTTQKYMHTPRGLFELKYFFSSHVDTENGGECSATAIRALIKKLVQAENSQRPLSDNKIAQVLGEQGIKVARRTIAKYREALAIPPSHERKTL